MGFCLECGAVNDLYNILSSCVNSGPWNVCHLKNYFTLSLDAVIDCNWVFHCFIS